VEAVDFLLELLVRVGYALVLTQMFQLRLEEERFQSPARLCRVLENAPGVSALPASFRGQVLHAVKSAWRSLGSIRYSIVTRTGPYSPSTSPVTMGVGP